MEEHKGCNHDDDADEALSLCDLARGEEDGDDSSRSPCHVRRSTAEELFEFLTDFSSEMCSAEDIIVCGKIAPSDVRNPARRRSESLSEVKLGSSNQSDNISRSSVMRNCRSLDYDKIHHHPVRSEQCRHSRTTHREKSCSDMLGKNRSYSRPRWYVIMFGPVSSDVQVQASDRLRDIKIRQLRRNPSNLLFPPRSENEEAGRGSLKDTSWKFLELLSCQGRGSVGVSSSYSACDKAS